jgi:alkanesulfonate monooxygenase SsuD/methylene tetrahydromethanopterin reductase-like flavin-dependent oxidoreductase (luciferase family)
VAEGRDPASVRRSVGLYTVVGADRRDLEARWRSLTRWAPGGALDGATPEEWGRDKLVGIPEQVLDRLAAFGRLGVEETILSVGPLPFVVPDDEMLDVVAERIIPTAVEL